MCGALLSLTLELLQKKNVRRNDFKLLNEILIKMSKIDASENNFDQPSRLVSGVLVTYLR